MATRPLLVLITGPTDQAPRQPGQDAANLARLEAAAWPVFAAGHVPMIGEWVALPVLRSADASVVDPLAEHVMYPTAQRLLEHCDAVLRLSGESSGADQDLAIAHARGLPVYYRIEDIPHYGEQSAGQR